MQDIVRAVDGEGDERKGIVSVFDELEPVIVIAPSIEDEPLAAAAFLDGLIKAGVPLGKSASLAGLTTNSRGCRKWQKSLG